MVEGRVNNSQRWLFWYLGHWRICFDYFFLMFNLIDQLQISVCKSYISHNVFSPFTLINHPCLPLNERQWKTPVSLFAVFQGLMENSVMLCQGMIFHINVCKAETMLCAVALYHIKQECPSKSLSVVVQIKGKKWCILNLTKLYFLIHK